MLPPTRCSLHTVYSDIMQRRKVLPCQIDKYVVLERTLRIYLWFLSSLFYFYHCERFYAKFLLDSPPQKTEELPFKIATPLFLIVTNRLTLFGSSENRVPITLRNSCTRFEYECISKIIQRLKSWFSSSLQIFWNQRKRLHEQNNIFFWYEAILFISRDIPVPHFAINTIYKALQML